MIHQNSISLSLSLSLLYTFASAFNILLNFFLIHELFHEYTESYLVYIGDTSTRGYRREDCRLILLCRCAPRPADGKILSCALFQYRKTYVARLYRKHHSPFHLIDRSKGCEENRRVPFFLPISFLLYTRTFALGLPAIQAIFVVYVSLRRRLVAAARIVEIARRRALRESRPFHVRSRWQRRLIPLRISLSLSLRESRDYKDIYIGV